MKRTILAILTCICVIFLFSSCGDSEVSQIEKDFNKSNLKSYKIKNLEYKLPSDGEWEISKSNDSIEIYYKKNIVMLIDYLGEYKNIITAINDIPKTVEAEEEIANFNSIEMPESNAAISGSLEVEEGIVHEIFFLVDNSAFSITGIEYNNQSDYDVDLFEKMSKSYRLIH